MAKRAARGDNYPPAMMVAAGVGTRLGMLSNATAGFGNKEGRSRRIGRKTAGMNLNWTPDQDRY